MLVAAFDAGKMIARIRPLLPRGAVVLTLDEARLPQELLTNQIRYLDRLNFATNFVFFRDQDGLSTRLVSANYWAGYGAGDDPVVATPVRCRRRRAGDLGAGSCRAVRAALRSTAARCGRALTCHRSPASCWCTRSVPPGTTW